MKQGIHPEYKVRTIQCVCGASYNVGSTREIRKLDICASCHPYFTGKAKYVDTAGRVEKFMKRYGKAGAGATSSRRARARSSGLRSAQWSG